MRWGASLLLALAVLVSAEGLPASAQSQVATGALPMETDGGLAFGKYRVTDPAAGYFDLAARRAFLAGTQDLGLRQQIEDLGQREFCAESIHIPVVTGGLPIPGFYDDRDGWRAAVEPYQAFEASVCGLAAQQVLWPERGAGLCLIALLQRWAEGGGLLEARPDAAGDQAWYQAESTLFAAAFAYAVAREDVPGRVAEKAAIEDWLARAARAHFAFHGVKRGTCCNNHYYRRAVYMTMIGVETGDDEMFRTGLAAIASALRDARANGALPLEMQRQQYAAKYQVFATMHLVMIAQIAQRQGYDLYALDIGGRRLDDLIGFATAALLLPEAAAADAETPGQDTSFLADPQYYGWLELLARREKWHDVALAILGQHRPTPSRSLGGYMSLYFAGAE